AAQNGLELQGAVGSLVVVDRHVVMGHGFFVRFGVKMKIADLMAGDALGTALGQGLPDGLGALQRLALAVPDRVLRHAGQQARRIGGVQTQVEAAGQLQTGGIGNVIIHVLAPIQARAWDSLFKAMAGSASSCGSARLWRSTRARAARQSRPALMPMTPCTMP